MLRPADLPWPQERVVGSAGVHRIFRGTSARATFPCAALSAGESVLVVGCSSV